MPHVAFWLPTSNLASLVICEVFIQTSTFCHINGNPEQQILVDTIFNDSFHFGLQEQFFTSARKTHALGAGGAGTQKVHFPDFSKDISWMSRVKPVVEYGVY